MSHNQDRPERIHLYGLDVAARALFLFGRDEYLSSAPEDDMRAEPGVEYSLANQLIRNIRLLEALSSEPITVHMKTCGGIWEEGMAIYDTIKTCKCHVTIISYTHARSMSSLILQAADERVLMPSSVVMIHLGQVSFGGTATQFHTEHEQQVKSDARMVDIYADVLSNTGMYRGQNLAWLKSWVRRKMKDKEDFYMSAEEAIEIGFADKMYA